MLPQVDEKLRTGSSGLLYLLEAMLYISVGVLLGAAALAVLVDAIGLLWRGILSRSLADYGLHVLDQLLLVLVLVEILHTVRMSIRSNSFSTLYAQVNKIIFEGRGEVLDKKQGLNMVPTSLIDHLNDGAHVAFPALSDVRDFGAEARAHNGRITNTSTAFARSSTISERCLRAVRRRSTFSAE